MGARRPSGDTPVPPTHGDRPRKVAQWAAVIGPIASMVLGAGVIIYEVLTNIANPAALGVGLTLAVGGKFADVLNEVLKPK